MLQLTLAVVHLLALSVGLPSVVARARALRSATQDGLPTDALRRALVADSLWGLSAVLWIGSGLWRYLAETEKSTAYYNRNHFFLAKMALLLAILLLELWPMVKLVGWRIALRGGAAETVAAPETARRIAAVSYVQAGLVVVMVFFAAAMARGLGAMPGG